ncbi:Plug domain-containing protein [Polaribacter sejongensis]|uniref:TonB-dependent receptor plug domain-containing protein n=1 Tax=Polaribacter sejongensis TaxID=985043 RepID=UPI0035A58B83
MVLKKDQILQSAVSSIKSDDLLKQPAANATQSIQGKLSGVNIINTNAPGSDPVVMIRGLGTAGIWYNTSLYCRWYTSKRY